MNALSDYSLLASLGSEIGGVIPDHVFFDPLPCFPEFIKARYPNKPVVDVGAGVGRMAKTLADAGIKVLAIDIYERENPEFKVYMMDATEFLYPPQSLPILARPCHGMFVEAAITNILNQVPEMLYVGLEKNFETDLSDLPYKQEVLPGVVGKNGEKVVVLTPNN